MYSILDGVVRHLELPTPLAEVLPGVRWGAFDELSTPAYWAGQAWQHDMLKTFEDLALGRSLVEEVAACLLGGYGMPAAVGLMAYERVRSLGLLECKPSAVELEAVLAEPLLIHGRKWTYRFPRQKARFLAECLRRLDEVDPNAADIELRSQLIQLPGIGLKTASWIVRNVCDSDRVAIIDVHILRVGRGMGLFDPAWTPEADYLRLESEFLLFADAIGTRASRLDGLIWSYSRVQRVASSQRELFD